MLMSKNSLEPDLIATACCLNVQPGMFCMFDCGVGNVINMRYFTVSFMINANPPPLSLIRSCLIIVRFAACILMFG